MFTANKYFATRIVSGVFLVFFFLLNKSMCFALFSFILNTVKPENSSVTSCLKILIRLARTNTDIAGKIVANTDLMHCVFKYFLPDLSRIGKY